MPTINNIIGTDGIRPIYEPEGLWKTWATWEIWDGTVGENRFVPKVNDHVIDPVSNERWIVDHLHPTTLIPTLRSIDTVKSGTLSDEDLLVGPGPGPDAQTYRAYLNKLTTPYTLSPEARCYIYGSMAEYVKIFKGSDTSQATGQVISKRYNNSGVFVSNNIPLQLAAIDSHNNYTIKTVPRCKITDDLLSGERITIVAYAADGHVVSKRQMVIEVSDLDMDVNSGLRYIDDISLESVWLTGTDTLEYPLNIPMDALNLIGVVRYSDGTTLKLPVDGGKFAMFGLQDRLASIPGQPKDLVLRYLMSPGEQGNASTGVIGQYITKPYRIVTTNPNYSIAVKLFAFPFWNSSLNEYRLRWWMLNLARNVWFEVTSHVEFSPLTGPFDPTLYGTMQRKRVSINLRNVSNAFIAFNHPQIVDIVLNSQPRPTDTQAAWTVATESSDQYPRYGHQVYARRTGPGSVNLQAEFDEYDDWLEAYFHQLRPLLDVTTEVAVPRPTHFIITHGTTVTEWSVANWNQNIAIGTAVSANDTVMIRWIRRTAQGDLQLAVGATMVKTV